jgi:hypothetical protein
VLRGGFHQRIYPSDPASPARSQVTRPASAVKMKSLDHVTMLPFLLDDSHLTPEDIAERNKHPAQWAARRYAAPEDRFRKAGSLGSSTLLIDLTLFQPKNTAVYCVKKPLLWQCNQQHNRLKTLYEKAKENFHCCHNPSKPTNRAHQEFRGR